MIPVSLLSARFVASASRTAASLRHRDFRLLWLGACTSSVGTWMQAIAENWLILSLTGSALFLGLDAFLQQVPILLFTLVGGVVADRRDRRRLLVVSQCVQMSSALVLALLVLTRQVQAWHILALSFLSGCAQAFGGPAYLALTPSLVEDADVSNAVALNSLQFNIARFLGPVMTGATLMLFRHEGWSETSALAACFALNAASFVVVIVALWSLRVSHIARVESRGVRDDLRLGLWFVGKNRALVAVVGLSGVIACTGYPLLTLLPLFAEHLAGAGIEGYSALMVFAGAGAIAGTLIAAWLGTFQGMARVTFYAAAMLGGLIGAFALSDAPWLTNLLLFLVGLGLMFVSSTLTSLAQLMAPDTMRGRVMGVYLAASRGGMPIGSLACGYLATLVSPSSVVGIGGMILCAAGMGSLIREREMWRLASDTLPSARA